jgi:hypothetical protein
MTSNLLAMVDSGEIAKTGAKPKLPTTIPNLTDNMLDVYRIPLKYLYYNDENGRISTQIKREYGALQPQSDEYGSDYNDKIATFIEEDNSAALKKTKKSIREKGQQVYGYVLKDGRVIDGNRRFTALRQLESETGATWYFEAVILPFSYDAKADRAQIKRLELAIQMGVEEKLQYDPVDLSVDVYNTIIVDELMTAKDYANEANMKLKDVEDRISTIELIHDFLQFINAKEDSYFIVKDTKLYNPLYELARSFAKNFPNKGPRYEQTKASAFVLLGKMVTTGGDTVREVRDYLKNVVTTPSNDEFNESIEDAVDDIRDSLEEAPIQSAADYRKRLESSVGKLRDISENYNVVTTRQNRGKNVDNFIGEMRKILATLNDINTGRGLTGSLSFGNFSKEQISEMRNMMVKINLVSADLIEVYEDEL